MTALERVIGRAYDLGALGTTEEARGFYEARGWKRWRGPTAALAPGGVVRTTEDDGSVYVLQLTTSLDLAGALVCDWRNGDLW